MKNNTDALRVSYYESAREELIERITLRDQTLVAYIASAGAYFGFVVSPRTSENTWHELGIVLVLPIISLVFAFVILQHHVMIGKIAAFIRREYAGAAHWDAEYAAWKDKSYLRARTFSQALLLLIPVGYTAAYAAQALQERSPGGGEIPAIVTTLAIDLSVLFWIVRLHFWAYRSRRETDG